MLVSGPNCHVTAVENFKFHSCWDESSCSAPFQTRQTGVCSSSTVLIIAQSSSLIPPLYISQEQMLVSHEKTANEPFHCEAKRLVRRW